MARFSTKFARRARSSAQTGRRRPRRSAAAVLRRPSNRGRPAALSRVLIGTAFRQTRVSEQRTASSLRIATSAITAPRASHRARRLPCSPRIPRLSALARDAHVRQERQVSTKAVTRAGYDWSTHKAAGGRRMPSHVTGLIWRAAVVEVPWRQVGGCGEWRGATQSLLFRSCACARWREASSRGSLRLGRLAALSSKGPGWTNLLRNYTWASVATGGRSRGSLTASGSGVCAGSFRTMNATAIAATTRIAPIRNATW